MPVDELLSTGLGDQSLNRVTQLGEATSSINIMICAGVYGSL